MLPETTRRAPRRSPGGAARPDRDRALGSLAAGTGARRQPEGSATRPGRTSSAIASREELDDTLDVEVGGEELAPVPSAPFRAPAGTAGPVRHGRGRDRLPSRPVSPRARRPRARGAVSGAPARPASRSAASGMSRRSRDRTGRPRGTGTSGGRRPTRKGWAVVLPPPPARRGPRRPRRSPGAASSGLSGCAGVEGLGQRLSGPELQAAVEEPAQAGGQRVVAREDADGSHRATLGPQGLGHGSDERGNCTTKVVPRPAGPGSAQSAARWRPRCCGRSRRPRPVPVAFVVKNGSKTRPRSPRGIPGPVSVT